MKKLNIISTFKLMGESPRNAKSHFTHKAPQISITKSQKEDSSRSVLNISSSLKRKMDVKVALSMPN